MSASVALAVGMLGPLTTALAVIGSDPGGSTANDDNAAVYQDGYRGTAGYLPVFHPTPLSPAEATTARTRIYAKTPSPDNLVLEFPDQFKASVACFGRGFDPRGPYAEPPRAPYLLPGNVAAMTFGDAEIEGGGLYIATSPTGFNDTVSGAENLNPASGPVVTAENKAGIFEVGLNGAGQCERLRPVSGGPTNAGFNGPHPAGADFGDFGSNIDGLSFHNGFLYANDFSGGPEGAHSGQTFSGGRLHRVNPENGERVALIGNLPSEGDHQNDAMVFFNDQGHEWIEFEQGTTTNSGTVDGEGVGDIPCFDVKLTPAGERFFPFTMGYKRTVKNLPGGASLVDAEPDGSVVVHGTLPCSGATMAIRADSAISADGSNSSIRLTGWGFRNPYGMVIAPRDVPGVGGELVLTNNDVDVRGQRPLANGADDIWPFEVNGTPPRNWGWPNQINFFSSADPQFGLGNNTLAGGAYTGNQGRRDATQPAQAIIGQAPIFNYLEDSTGHLFREGNVVPEAIDAEFVPGVSLATVDISADGIDVVRNRAFGGTELLHNFLFTGFGNLEFPLGSVPAAMVGKDVRRLKIETTASGAYVGAVQKVFAHNKVQPGGWPNLNTGGFLGPLDLKFSPSGRAMWVVDFGGFFTKDSGAVGGFRCDPNGDCARGAKQFPKFAVPSKEYGITIEQAAGTSLLWRFAPADSEGED